MKFLLLGLISVISFLGTLVGALALTGNLSADAVKRIVSGTPAESAAPGPTSRDPLGPLAEALNQKEAQLKEREQALRQREARVEQREKELERLRADIETMRSEISTAMDEADAQQEERRKTVADTLAAMRPENAARTLESMPRDEVAAILNLVPNRNRGKIMDAMKEPDTASDVLQALQDQRL